MAVENEHAISALRGRFRELIEVHPVYEAKAIVGKASREALPESVGIHVVVEVLASVIGVFEDNHRWNFCTT